MATLHLADARAMPLPDASVHMCVTSPPYWGLRDYGLGKWQGGDAECGHKKDNPSKGRWEGKWDNYDGQFEPWKDGICGHCGAIQQAAGIGLEPTLGEWVQNIVAVMREVRRVLRDDGTCWLNLGMLPTKTRIAWGSLGESLLPWKMKGDSAERHRLAQAQPDARVGAGPAHQRIRDDFPAGEVRQILL